MLKIRLMRIGTKKRPFYRVVAVDERAKRTGGYLELLGTYNPLTEPHEIKLNQERIDSWVKKGAQLSDGFLRIIGKAPQKPPRKPKKAASAESSGEPKEKKEEPQPIIKIPEEEQISEAEVKTEEASAETQTEVKPETVTNTETEETPKEPTPEENQEK